MRGRPKSDQKRRQILGAAVEHFLTEGYGATSLDAVAKTAGVSKQTIYSHFEGKSALLEECIQDRCRESILADEALDFNEPPELFLHSFAARFIDTLCDSDPINLWRLCAAECERNREIGEVYFNSGPRVVMDAVAHYLTLANERGDLVVPDPTLAAAQFLFIVKGLPVDTQILNLKRWPYRFSAQEYTEASVKLFLNAHRV